MKDPVGLFFDHNGKFLHNVFGKYLIDEYHVCLINGGLHVYDGQIYSAANLDEVMISILDDITERRCKEVRHYLANCPETPRPKLAPPELIPLKSKVYDIANDRFLDYSPDLVFLNRFPWDYDPNAPKSEKIMKLIYDVSDHDIEVFELILEAIGSTLFRENRYRASFMLYGPSGNNGKSTLLNMITQFIGEQNVSYLSLQDTADKYRGTMIYGKAANIGDDIPDQLLKDSSIYKKLVTGEVIVGERKYADPVAFRPYAKLFFAANSLPPVSDRSRAFFSRLMVIPLEHDFSQDGDRSLKDYHWSEADMLYLMKEAIAALKRVIKAETFIMPTTVKELINEYEMENNPVLGFLNEYDKRIEGQSAADVYARFGQWCASAGHRYLIGRTKFSRELGDILNLTTEPRNGVRVFVKKK